jgi:predicted nucleic acid-binding protein
MIAAVDTNVLLDILIPDEEHGPESKAVLNRYNEQGRLVICESVFAELSSQFPSEDELLRFLSQTGIKFIRSEERALTRAGKAWKEYSARRPDSLLCSSCGNPIVASCTRCRTRFKPRQHIISDFLIGAHALVHAEILLTRDRGFYRTYFKDLKIG